MGLRSVRRRTRAVGLTVALAACNGAGDAAPATSDPAPPTTSDVNEAAPTTVTAVPSTEPARPAAIPWCTVDGEVLDLAVAGDAVYFVGDFTQVTDASGRVEDRAGIGACSLTGDVTAFDPEPVDGKLRVVEVAGDRLFVGGSFQAARRQNFAALRRTDGSIDESWGPGEVVGGVHEIIVTAEGAVYVGGGIRAVDGAKRTGVARLLDTGELDAGFSPALAADESEPLIVTALAEHDDRVYIGGDFSSLNDEPVPGVGAVDLLTGRVTGGFRPDLTDPNPEDGRVQIRTVIVAEPWVYLCGDWWTTEGRGDKEAQRNVGRFDFAGAADASFEPATDGGVRDCALTDDDLVVGGHFDTVAGERSRKSTWVSLADGAARPIVDADTPKGVQTVAPVDGGLVLGGTFRNVDGQPSTGLAFVVDPN